MNKKELIKTVSTKTGFTQHDVTPVVDATFEAITNAMKNGDSVRVTSFGTFSSVGKVAKKCRNPNTGEEMIVPAYVAARFRPAAALKDALN